MTFKPLFTLILFLLGANLFAQGDSIALYSLDNYQGRSVFVEQSVPSMKARRLVGISSIKIPKNTTVTLYKGVNFQGHHLVLRKSVPSLGRLRFGGFSSMKIEKKHRPTRQTNRIRENVSLFVNPNYQGSVVQINRDQPNLKRRFNDQIESIRVPKGWVVTLYEHENYRGRAEVFRSDDPNLSNSDIGANSVSSIKLRYYPPHERPAPRAMIKVYKDNNFRGRSEILSQSDADLSDNIIGNDAISSLKIPANMEVILYAHANFRGRSVTLNEDMNSLKSLDFNDKVSSIKIKRRHVYVPIDQKQEGILLFEHRYYQGKNKVIFDDCSNLALLNFGNKTLSSIQIPAGYEVILYEGPNFTGRSEMINCDDGDLGNNQIGNDRVSSIRIRHQH